MQLECFGIDGSGTRTSTVCGANSTGLPRASGTMPVASPKRWAQTAFKQAVRAHAMGEEWTMPCESRQRDDSEYSEHGPELRVGLLVAMHREGYDERLRAYAIEKE